MWTSLRCRLVFHGLPCLFVKTLPLICGLDWFGDLRVDTLILTSLLEDLVGDLSPWFFLRVRKPPSFATNPSAFQDLFCFDAPQLTQGMTVTCAEWNSNNKATESFCLVVPSRPLPSTSRFVSG